MALRREAESKGKIRWHLLYLIVGKWLWDVCKGTDCSFNTNVPTFSANTLTRQLK